jgi:hypothetical protein
MRLKRYLFLIFACPVVVAGGYPAPPVFAHTDTITNQFASAERCADHIDSKPIHATLDMSMHSPSNTGFETVMTAKQWWAYAADPASSDPCDTMAYIRVKLARNTYMYIESSWESTDPDFTSAGFEPPDYCQHSTAEMALFGRRAETGQWELVWVYVDEQSGNYTPASTRIYGSPPTNVKSYCSHSPEWAIQQNLDFGTRRFLMDPWDDAAPGYYTDYRLVASNWMHNVHNGSSTQTDCRRESCYYPIKLYGWTWPN